MVNWGTIIMQRIARRRGINCHNRQSSPVRLESTEAAEAGQIFVLPVGMWHRVHISIDTDTDHRPICPTRSVFVAGTAKNRER